MFASTTSFAVKPGQRDAMVAHLHGMRVGGMPSELLLFEVGVNDAAPDTVFLLEVWESEAAQKLRSGTAAMHERMAEALPLIERMSATRFELVDPPAAAMGPGALPGETGDPSPSRSAVDSVARASAIARP